MPSTKPRIDIAIAVKRRSDEPRLREQVSRALMIAMVTLSFARSVVCAGPLEDAKAAYDHGDYATALQLLRPLAEKGSAKAQLFLGAIVA